MIHQKFSRIIGILFEPRTRTAQAETVAPGIHVSQEPFLPYTIDVVGEQNLKVTNSGFFKIATTGIPVKPATPFTIHANDMAGLVQERVDRCIRPHEYRMPDNPRLGITPEAAGNRFVRGLDRQFESKPLEKFGQCGMTNVDNPEYAAQSVEICLSTIRTRSSTMASRSNSSSFVLPSTSVES